jgi:hypothetical protein
VLRFRARKTTAKQDTKDPAIQNLAGSFSADTSQHIGGRTGRKSLQALASAKTEPGTPSVRSANTGNPHEPTPEMSYAGMPSDIVLTASAHPRTYFKHRRLGSCYFEQFSTRNDLRRSRGTARCGRRPGVQRFFVRSHAAYLLRLNTNGANAYMARGKC